jgi:ribosomal protein S18 acetylase RimI-like enzyme
VPLPITATWIAIHAEGAHVPGRRHPSACFAPRMSDVERAFAFMRRGDILGTNEQAWRFGTAVSTPELPLRHDSNYLLLECDGPAEEVARDAERAQTELGHRMILVPDEGRGARLAPDFKGLGWEVARFLVMVHRRPPARPVDTSIVDEVADVDLRQARELNNRQYPWATPEVTRQQLEARRMNPLECRYFAVRVNGFPVSFTDLYLECDTGQVEAVATLEEHRGRGYARAVVTRAVEEARRAGATFVFLVADAEDWPKELYRKLGFDEAGRYFKFSRVVAA